MSSDDTRDPDESTPATWTDERGHVWHLLPSGEPFSLDAAVERMIAKDEEAERALFLREGESQGTVNLIDDAPSPVVRQRTEDGPTALEISTRALVDRVVSMARDGCESQDMEDLIVQFLEQNDGYRQWVYDAVRTYPSGEVSRTRMIFGRKLTADESESLTAELSQLGYQCAYEFVGHGD